MSDYNDEDRSELITHGLVSNKTIYAFWDCESNYDCPVLMFLGTTAEEVTKAIENIYGPNDDDELVDGGSLIDELAVDGHVSEYGPCQILHDAIHVDGTFISGTIDDLRKEVLAYVKSEGNDGYDVDEIWADMLSNGFTLT